MSDSREHGNREQQDMLLESYLLMKFVGRCDIAEELLDLNGAAGPEGAEAVRQEAVAAIGK